MDASRILILESALDPVQTRLAPDRAGACWANARVLTIMAWVIARPINLHQRPAQLIMAKHRAKISRV